MNIDVRTKGFDITAGIREHVERRVEFGLGRFGHDISDVRVTLEDVNGPKGGLDKHVAVMIDGPALQTVRIEQEANDTYAAIDVAMGRAAETVGQALELRRDQQRGKA